MAQIDVLLAPDPTLLDIVAAHGKIALVQNRNLLGSKCGFWFGEFQLPGGTDLACAPIIHLSPAMYSLLMDTDDEDERTLVGNAIRIKHIPIHGT